MMVGENADLLIKLRWAVSTLWLEDHFGRDILRLMKISEDGFWYDGQGLLSPKFQGWNEGRLWDLYFGRGLALIARAKREELARER